MARGKWLSEEEKAIIVGMHTGGMTAAQIAAQMERGVKSIQRVLSNKQGSAVATCGATGSPSMSQSQPPPQRQQRFVVASSQQPSPVDLEPAPALVPPAPSKNLQSQQHKHITQSTQLPTRQSEIVTSRALSTDPRAVQSQILPIAEFRPQIPVMKVKKQTAPRAQVPKAAAKITHKRPQFPPSTNPISTNSGAQRMEENGQYAPIHGFSTMLRDCHTQEEQAREMDERADYHDHKQASGLAMDISDDDSDDESDNDGGNGRYPSPPSQSYADQLAACQRAVRRPPRLHDATNDPPIIHSEVNITSRTATSFTVNETPSPRRLPMELLRNFEDELQTSEMESPNIVEASQVEPEPCASKKRKADGKDLFSISQPPADGFNDAMSSLGNAVCSLKKSKPTGYFEARLHLLFQRFQADVGLVQLDAKRDAISHQQSTLPANVIV